MDNLFSPKNINDFLNKLKANAKPEPEQPEPVIPPLKIVWPPDYVFNNSPEFYETITTKVESGNPFFLLFVGPTGCGKSYLATIIMDMAAAHYQWKTYQKMQCPQFYKAYQAAKLADFSIREDRMEGFEQNQPWTRFVMDDLGAEIDEPQSRDYFAMLIDNNYVQIREHTAKAGIITTNLDPAAIEARYGSRTLDRLLENYLFCFFKPESFREKKAAWINGAKK